tara:strand:+ start:174 stop:428 length:255 start_codon:yes stop_codon:yes gene_type:complete
MAKQKITRELAILSIANQVRNARAPISWTQIRDEIYAKYIVRKNGWMLVRNALQELKDADVIDRVDDVHDQFEEYVLSAKFINI